MTQKESAENTQIKIKRNYRLRIEFNCFQSCAFKECQKYNKNVWNINK